MYKETSVHSATEKLNSVGTDAKHLFQEVNVSMSISAFYYAVELL
jgi:hypothetical protein